MATLPIEDSLTVLNDMFPTIDNYSLYKSLIEYDADVTIIIDFMIQVKTKMADLYGTPKPESAYSLHKTFLNKYHR